MYRFCAASSATPLAEGMTGFVIVIDGTLPLWNGCVKKLTLLPNDEVMRSPTAVNATWPTFDDEPLLNVADGVLEADIGAEKNGNTSASAPAARFPFASTPSATTLFDANAQFGV